MKIKLPIKKLLFGIILVLIFAGIYFGYKKSAEKRNETRYILSQVKKGTIVVSVSGSGQISTSDQIDIKPKVSGEIEKIFVEKDQRVKRGDLLLKLKTKDFERAIDEAKLALDNAKITLDNLKINKENSQKDLKESYENAFVAISSVFKDFPQILKTLEPIFTESTYGGDQGDIDYYRKIFGFYSGKSFPENEKENEFSNLKEKYEKLRQDYFLISRFSPPDILENWLDNTSNLVKEASDLTRSARDIISFYKETLSKENITPPIPITITDNQFNILASTTASFDQTFSNLTFLSRKIEKLKNTLSDLEEQIDFQSKQLRQKEEVLEKAKENYENCFIGAPFSGKITKISVKEGDMVSSATLLLSLISDQKIAQVSLNEVDAAKVKLGQEATLTFDALPELTLTGRVSEIDSVGTVSQGVVSFGVKIVLDSDDERIKPGMSVTAEIVVEAKSDVLVLPNNAIKSEAGSYFVELVEIPAEKREEYLNNRAGVILPISPKRQQIEVGISNDSLTEIVSGLKEGDIVISSTITPTQAFQKTQQIRVPGMGGQMRFPR